MVLTVFISIGTSVTLNGDTIIHNVDTHKSTNTMTNTITYKRSSLSAAVFLLVKQK